MNLRRLLHTALNHPLRCPVFVLGLASLIGCAVLVARVAITGHARHLYLPWNLFLAWVPLLLALTVGRLQEHRDARRWKVLAAAFAWLMFFPNAPYIFTDLIHLGAQTRTHWWADLVLILLFALTGLVLGFLSLFLMQRLVAQRFGWYTGWLFVGAVAGLSGFGIYLGRFLRWNSWDVLVNPLGLSADVGHWLVSIPSRPPSLIIPAMFATLLFLTYLMFYALTHLPNHLTLPLDAEPESPT